MLSIRDFDFLKVNTISSQQPKYRRNVLQHNKGVYNKSTANIIFSGEAFKSFSLNQEKRKDAYSCYHLIVLEVLAEISKKKNKRHLN